MVDKRDIRRSYDELAATYAAQRSEHDRGTELLERFLACHEDADRILDAGCGPGTPVLARLAGTAPAIGLDFSREQLQLAGAAVPTAGLVQGDLEALPFRAATFDAIVALWSVIHVPLPGHQPVIDEFARVSRPGGELLLCEGTNAWRGENPDWLDSGVSMAWNIAGADATATHLREAGFAIVDRWGVPETLGDDGDDTEDASGDQEHPWTFFRARYTP